MTSIHVDGKQVCAMSAGWIQSERSRVAAARRCGMGGINRRRCALSIYISVLCMYFLYLFLAVGIRWANLGAQRSFGLPQPQPQRLPSWASHCSCCCV